MPGSHEALVQEIVRSGVSPRVADALRAVDRAGFVPSDKVHAAYEDRPVELPRGQTTSQPSLIALMLDAAAIEPTDRVLEVGTGYGYQTALAARLAAEVVSIERHEELADAARRNLERNGVDGVSVLVGDGYEGWASRAPYQAIVVSAAAPDVPGSLLEQLGEGGRLVIPVATLRGDDVILVRKVDGRARRVALVSPARFVPLVRGAVVR